MAKVVQLHGRTKRTFKVGFLPLEQFTLIALSSAIEPLRMANHLTGEALYDWQLIRPAIAPVTASGGTSMLPNACLNDVGDLDLIIVVAGVNVKDNIEPEILAWLKKRATSNVLMGGLCTGPLVLAQAGLLDGYNCSAHWECLAALQEDYPRIFCNNNLFTFDRDRITCTGGDVALHMMLHLVADHYGAPLANAISDMFVCDRIRDSQEPQRLRMENNVFASQPKLASAVQLMEANIEEPIDLVDVAAYSGVSRRQLERLFLNFLGITPSRFYLKVRLERAKQLLRQTTCSIVDISSICGFESTAHFNRTYKKYMSLSPKSERSLRVTLGSNLVLTEEATGLIPNIASEALAFARRETSFGILANHDADQDASQHPEGLGEG